MPSPWGEGVMVLAATPFPLTHRDLAARLGFKALKQIKDKATYSV